MKTKQFVAMLEIISTLILVLPLNAFTQENQQSKVTTHYVVIGVFADFSNANRFTKHAIQMNLHALIKLNANLKLYYVYVLKTINQIEAVEEALRLRKQSELAFTWVYHDQVVKENSNLAVSTQNNGIDAESDSGQKSESIKTENQPNEVTTLANPQQPTTVSSTETESIAKITPSVEGANFFFKIFRASDKVILEGDVDVIDVDRTRKVGTYKGNTGIKVSDPASKSDNISLVCEVFGYRKIQKDVNFNLPEGEGIIKTDKGLMEIPFELIRLRKGDIAVMYNVFFYKDAAIMRPESKFEVTGLLDMMKENPACKIKIHGHANGGGQGKIITMEKGSTNFFTLTGGIDGFGSSTQLSQERAEIIRDYLLNNGIEESRLQVKAWGGKRPIQDKNSVRAQENVRVEIEILEN